MVQQIWGGAPKDPLFDFHILEHIGKNSPSMVPVWPLHGYRELKTPWHIIGLSLCEVAVNLWSICKAHQKSWVLYIIGWGQSIPTLTGYLILYEWIKSHSHSYWTAKHRLMGFMAHFTGWSLDGRWNIPAHLFHPQQSIYHLHKSWYAAPSLWMIKESTEEKCE